RAGQEDAAGAGPGVPAAVRVQRDLPAAGESVRAARQLRSGELARDPGADPKVRGGGGDGGARGGGVGDGAGGAGGPGRGGGGGGDRAGGRAVRRGRAGERGGGAGDLDPGTGGADRAADGVHGPRGVGRQQARRAAAAHAGHLAGGDVVRLRG